MQLPEMMQCDRLSMKLSTPGCARLWRSAQESRPKEHEGRYACLTCTIGAANAGASLPPTAAATEALRTVCPRCERRATRFIAGRLCISCYNRDREVRIGKNAKGNRPLLTDVLRAANVVIIEAADSRIEHSVVTGLPEVMISIARTATGVLAFGRLNPMEA
jgi:hypothetical protein